MRLFPIFFFLVYCDALMPLDSFIRRIAPLGKGRFIAMKPDKSVIIEATVDMSSATISTTKVASGLTLLTIASPDKSFECHLDVSAAKNVALAMSPKTGGYYAVGIKRCLDI